MFKPACRWYVFFTTDLGDEGDRLHGPVFGPATKSVALAAEELLREYLARLEWAPLEVQCLTPLMCEANRAEAILNNEKLVRLSASENVPPESIDSSRVDGWEAHFFHKLKEWEGHLASVAQEVYYVSAHLTPFVSAKQVAQNVVCKVADEECANEVSKLVELRAHEDEADSTSCVTSGTMMGPAMSSEADYQLARMRALANLLPDDDDANRGCLLGLHRAAERFLASIGESSLPVSPDIRSRAVSAVKAELSEADDATEPDADADANSGEECPNFGEKCPQTESQQPEREAGHIERLRELFEAFNEATKRLADIPRLELSAAGQPFIQETADALMAFAKWFGAQTPEDVRLDGNAHRADYTLSAFAGIIDWIAMRTSVPFAKELEGDLFAMLDECHEFDRKMIHANTVNAPPNSTILQRMPMSDTFYSEIDERLADISGRADRLAERLMRAELVSTPASPIQPSGDMAVPGNQFPTATFVLHTNELKILKLLSLSNTTRLQVDIETDVELSRKTVQNHLKKLRKAGLTDRPNGERGGDAITDKGRAKLSQCDTSEAH